MKIKVRSDGISYAAYHKPGATFCYTHAHSYAPAHIQDDRQWSLRLTQRWQQYNHRR